LEGVNYTEELDSIISDLESARTRRDEAAISAGVTQLLAWLKRFYGEPFASDSSTEALSAAWLLTKCAENLRALEWQMTTKWDEVGRTTDIAERCALQLSEAVSV
jgi:hypothetical protein